MNRVVSAPNQYFVYAISCSKTSNVFVGISKSQSKYYNPINYFIDKATEGKYKLLNHSICNYGKASHVLTKVTRPDQFLELEAAEQMQYKLVKFYDDKHRSLNDSNIEPIRYTCACGYRILEQLKDEHICRLDVSKAVLEELKDLF